MEFLPDAGHTGNYLVGARGFEPPTPCSRSRCATRLRYAPTLCGAGYISCGMVAIGFFAFPHINHIWAALFLRDMGEDRVESFAFICPVC